MKKILFLLLAVICCGLHAQQPFSSGKGGKTKRVNMWSA